MGLLAIGQDITERRNLEAQLRHAQKMEAVGRLAGAVAHDFRNQLTVIIGYADKILSTASVDDQHAASARNILDAADRSSKLTGHMLAFSRKEPLRPEVVAPAKLIARLADPLEHMIGRKVRITTSVADDLDNISIDTAQFENMMINLAINARDAMLDGGDLTIDVQAAELDSEHTRINVDAAPGGYVAIAVTDTGVGMGAKTLQNIFDPFFTTKPVGQGTGLGLSMVHGFVRQSGGNITVDSEPGRGTTFTIYLPTTVDQPAELAKTAETPKGRQEASAVRIRDK